MDISFISKLVSIFSFFILLIVLVDLFASAIVCIIYKCIECYKPQSARQIVQNNDQIEMRDIYNTVNATEQETTRGK